MKQPPHLRLLLRKGCVALFAVLIVVSISMPAVGSSTAQEQLLVEVDLPDSVSANEAVSISSSVTIPERVEDRADLSITLYVDGAARATKTITSRDRETTKASFEHTFQTAGTHSVGVEAKITWRGRTLSGDASTSIEVTQSKTAISTVSGAAFSTPKSLTDEIEAYRGQTGSDLAPNAFVLASEDQLYLVFTDNQPRTGIATVEGVSTDQQISAQGLSFNILLASSGSFDTTVTKATVGEIVATPEAYQRELVQISATHRRISSLTDLDQGNDFTVASSQGILIENPLTTKQVLSQIGPRIRSLTINASTNKRGSSTAKDALGFLKSDQPNIYTVGFEKTFWRNSDATVTGIVLTPGSAARKFIATFDSKPAPGDRAGSPILYVTEAQPMSQQYDSVTALQNEAQAGDVVSVTGNFYAQQTSVQETVEHSTSCGSNRAQVPTPSGPVCIDISQDVLIYSGVTWAEAPQSKRDLLFTVGISSRHLDQPSEPIKGRYRIVGKLVSSDQFSESLPDGRVLVIYNLERVGSIQSGIREPLRAATERITSLLREQIVSKQNGAQASSETVHIIRGLSPEERAEITLNQSDSSLRKIQLNVSTQVQKASVQVTPITSLPESVPSPPSEAIKLLNISVSGASDSEIDSGTLHLSINRSRVSNPAQLVVYRFHGGSWGMLDTNSGIVGDKVLFSAKTPGFSYFAIGLRSSDYAVESESTDMVNSGDSSVTESADGVFTKLLPKSIPTGGWIVIGVTILSSIEALRRRGSRDSSKLKTQRIISRLIVSQTVLDWIFYASAAILFAAFATGVIGFYQNITLPRGPAIGFIVVSGLATVGMLFAGLLTSMNVVLRYIERRVSGEEQTGLAEDTRFYCKDCGHSWTQPIGEEDEVIHSGDHLEIQWREFSNTTVTCSNCSAKTSVECTDSTSWR